MSTAKCHVDDLKKFLTDPKGSVESVVAATSRRLSTCTPPAADDPPARRSTATVA
jgi:hypothetical protein